MTDQETPPPALGKGPSPVTAPKLSFGAAPARASTLPTLAPPPRTAASPPTAAPPEPTDSAPVPRQSRTTPRRPARRAPTAKPRSSSRKPPPEPDPVDGPDGVGIYVPGSLRRQLRTYAANHPGRTYTDIVLDAIEANAARLGDLLAKPPTRTGPLFAGRTPLRRRHDEDQVQITLRPAPDDLAVIDALVDEHRATNRSEFIAVALAAYLAPGDRA